MAYLLTALSLVSSCMYSFNSSIAKQSSAWRYRLCALLNNVPPSEDGASKAPLENETWRMPDRRVALPGNGQWAMSSKLELRHICHILVLLKPTSQQHQSRICGQFVSFILSPVISTWHKHGASFLPCTRNAVHGHGVR